LGLLTIATILKLYGHEPIVYDGPIESIPLDFDYYGLGPSVTEYSSAIQVKNLIKHHNSKVRIVAGGPHPTVNPEECLRDGFDCVVVGDGEPVVERAFFSDARLIQEDYGFLSDYPIADRSFIDIKSYEYFIDGILATPIVTTKGCPFNCGFCSKVYKGVRIRSSDHVIKEIDYLHFDLGYDAIMFFDDTFILNTKRVETIAKHLNDLGMKWRCLVRGDLIAKYGIGFVRMLYDNGCVEVGMGIESGSDRILSIINKGENTATIRTAIRMLKDNGIRVKGFFILGLPGEDEESINETDRFVAETGLDDMDFSLFKPYAGSPIYKNKEAYDIQWDSMDYSETYYKGNGRHKGGNIRTSNLTNEQIVNAMYQLEKKYKHGFAERYNPCS
jgi:radical SAM superfamily enzyme YgiQ (UPF0313 family)